MGWIVYDRSGKIERCTIKELEYNGSFMGERTIACSIESPSVINFAIGDHITYRGEEFYLDYEPSQTKSASFGSVINAFKYDLIFRTIDIELQNCQLLDYVPYGNNYHYQPSPSFSFVGTAKTFAERIQANMDRDYPGWKIEVYDGIETEDAEIEIDNVSCWNALVMINKEFGLNFFISKRNVKIGYPEESLDHTFYYGKNNGLYQIERDVNADEVVVTRLYAYGGERNIPDDYNKRDSDFSGKKNLMLPGYLETGKSYIESKNLPAYGVREYTMVFEEIYPSIAGVELPDIGRIDELVAAEQITKETETKGTFKITIKNIGFNIKDYLTTETATISMKSGSLIGYEFEIVDVVQLESGNYDITLNKSTRDDFQVPNAGQNLSAGDRFVILNIKMPEKYVEYAEDRLLKAATSYLAEHDHVIYTYNIGVDEIYMARNGNLHDLIREGMKLPLYDVDFGTDYSIIIQSLSIREGESIPTYDISLSDKPIASTIDKIWDAIDNVRNEGSTSTGGSIIGGGASPEELNKKYLRKDVNDTAKGSIHFEREIGSSIFIDGWEGKGWEIQSTGAALLDSLRVRSDIYVGGNTGSPTFASGFTGWGWQIDTPTATGEMDNLFIRKTFTAYEIVYSQIYGLGGSQIVSDINKIARVEVMADRYRCYMDDMDGLMLMNLRKGDGVRIQTRTGTTSIKYLFGRCIGVDSDYFDIAIPLIEGTGQPEAGDFALRWGSNEDTDRQGLIYLTTADSGAPFIDVYDGITEASTEGKLKARLGHLTGVRTQRGDQLSGYGAYLNGIYVENSTFIMQNGDTIEQTFIAMNGKFESLIDGVRNDMSSESGNILVNSSFSQNTNYWTAANTVHFINVGGRYLWMDSNFYVEKDQVADIYNDDGRNVLRIRNTYILQQNGIMNIPEHTEAEEKTYSFSLYYKVLRAGSCGFGIPGTPLYLEQQLPESDSYQKLSKVGLWDGAGNFELRFTGEILIYGVGLFPDEIADAVIKLQTQIDQTDEYIKLLATKDYVDSETNEIYIHYDSQLQITAEQMSGITTKVDNINNTIESAGWITRADSVALFAKKEMEGGKAIVNAINVGTDGILIQANRINLVGAVTFSTFDYSLQSTINGKANSSSLGNLAYEDYVTDSDLSYTLSQTISNKVSSSALKRFALVNGTDITKGDLESALQTEINNKLTGSATTSGNKLANVIINGKTLIAGGYIQADLINATDIVATNIAATTGTVGGWYVGSDFLSNSKDGKGGTPISSAHFDMYSTSNPGGNFLHMNPAASTILSIRADDKTGLSIYSQSTSGRCISLTAQTGSVAMDAVGGSDWYQRSGEIWNMPGVLTVYKITSSPSTTWLWGNGATISGISKMGTGRFKINCTTSGQYVPMFISSESGKPIHGRVAQISSTGFELYTDALNDNEYAARDFSVAYIVLFGRNRIIA
ncbi:hypothetical protein [uncultured Parabacteroides sp.]|uniref:hypothetical protein n=1 Tax=uncultured Parabacteroides sp. TaxID=512312 RepID=UPI0025FA52D2|nr:hypothetical protein [uncultured Parabacteroides sp.]